MMYKILNNLAFVDHDLEFNTNQTRGHPFKLTALSTRINICHNSFFPLTIILWNNLPATVVTCNSFKKKIVTVIY